MNIWKKAGFALLALAGTASLCACGSGEKDGESGEGGLVPPVEGIQMPGHQGSESEDSSSGEDSLGSSASEGSMPGEGSVPGGEGDPEGSSPGDRSPGDFSGGQQSGSLGLYSARIREYMDGIESGWGQQEFEEAGMSYMCGYLESLDQLGYLLLDLDGNGMEELLIGKDTVIYDMYTMESGVLKHIFSGGERNAYGLTKDNIICNIGSDSAATTFYSYYTLDGALLTPVRYVIFDAYYSPEAPWFESRDSAGAEGAAGILEEEAGKIIDEYRAERLDYTTLDCFWQDLGKMAGKEPGMEEQPYFGTWKIQEYRTGAVYALSQEEIADYLTYTVTYYEDAVAQNGVDLGLEDFGYEYEFCTKEDILADFRVDLSDWWAEEETVVHGIVNSQEDFFGRVFFLGDDNSLWIYYEGVFFRAAK